jgi:hypothetical protein
MLTGVTSQGGVVMRLKDVFPKVSVSRDVDVSLEKDKSVVSSPVLVVLLERFLNKCVEVVHVFADSSEESVVVRGKGLEPFRFEDGNILIVISSHVMVGSAREKVCLSVEATWVVDKLKIVEGKLSNPLACRRLSFCGCRK